MNVDEFREYCLAFPQATENLQWGDDLCFKIRGKIFAIVNLSGVPAALCFKCVPQTFQQLCEREGIKPAPYVGRYKWVMVHGLSVLSDAELRDLVGQSYEMVAAKAPKSSSPRKRGKRRSVIRKSSGRKRGGGL